MKQCFRFFLMLFFALLSGSLAGSSAHAQGLPSWAAPAEVDRPERQPFEPRTDRMQNQRPTAPDHGMSMHPASKEETLRKGFGPVLNNKTCNSDADCNGNGQVCLGGECVKSRGTCTTDADCRNNESCIDGRCFKDSQIPPGVPIDGGLGFLTVAGAVYAVHRLRRKEDAVGDASAS